MATIAQPLRRSGLTFGVVLRGIWARIRPVPRVHLSAHLARDAGLDPDVPPLGRIEMPSEVWTHPRL